MRFLFLLGLCALISGCSIGKSTVLVPFGTACKDALEVELVRHEDELERKRRPSFSKDDLINQFDDCDSVATVVSAVPAIIVVGASAYAFCLGEGKCGSDDDDGPPQMTGSQGGGGGG